MQAPEEDLHQPSAATAAIDRVKTLPIANSQLPSCCRLNSRNVHSRRQQHPHKPSPLLVLRDAYLLLHWLQFLRWQIPGASPEHSPQAKPCCCGRHDGRSVQPTGGAEQSMDLNLDPWHPAHPDSASTRRAAWPNPDDRRDS